MDMGALPVEAEAEEPTGAFGARMDGLNFGRMGVAPGGGGPGGGGGAVGHHQWTGYRVFSFFSLREPTNTPRVF